MVIWGLFPFHLFIFLKKQIIFSCKMPTRFFITAWIEFGQWVWELSLQSLRTTSYFISKVPALAVLRPVLSDSCACWSIIIESYLCIFFLWVFCLFCSGFLHFYFCFFFNSFFFFPKTISHHSQSGHCSISLAWDLWQKTFSSYMES